MPFQTEHLRTSFLAATMVETAEEKKLATNHTQNHARYGRSAACFNLVTLILEPCVQVPDSWWKLAFPDWIDLCDLGRAWAVNYGPRSPAGLSFVWFYRGFDGACWKLGFIEGPPKRTYPAWIPYIVDVPWMKNHFEQTLGQLGGNLNNETTGPERCGN